MKRRGITAGFLLVILATVTATLVVATSGYTISWAVFSGGGGHSSGGRYTLEGAIGQPVAALSGGGTYQVCTGFWCTEFPQHTVFPVIMKKH